MTKEAFWDVYKPGCDEHLMVHKIRKTDAFIKKLGVFEKQFPCKEKKFPYKQS